MKEAFAAFLFLVGNWLNRRKHDEPITHERRRIGIKASQKKLRQAIERFDETITRSDPWR